MMSNDNKLNEIKDAIDVLVKYKSIISLGFTDTFFISKYIAKKFDINEVEALNIVLKHTALLLYEEVKKLQDKYSEDIWNYINSIVTYRGNYSPKLKYKIYDAVKYADKYYICKGCSDNVEINVLPTDSTYWSEFE